MSLSIKRKKAAWDEVCALSRYYRTGIITPREYIENLTVALYPVSEDVAKGLARLLVDWERGISPDGPE